MEDFNYYNILKVERTATDSQIKRAYREAVRLSHPDAHGNVALDDSEFCRIVEAYNVLSNPSKRARYNSQLRDEDIKRMKAKKFADINSSINYCDSKKTLSNYASRIFKHQSLKKIINSEWTNEKIIPVNFTKDLPKKQIQSLSNKIQESVKSISERLSKKTLKHELEIDALQSIQGAVKEVSIKTPQGVRLYRVKIPALIQNGECLRITQANREIVAEIKVKIIPHPLVSRNKEDITMKIPVTLKEAVNGASLTLNTPAGQRKLEISPLTEGIPKRFRLEGCGLRKQISKINSNETHSSTSQQSRLNKLRGDFIVEPFISLPVRQSVDLKTSALRLESCYSDDIRKILPEKF